MTGLAKKRKLRASTIAEVLVGMVVLSMVVLAVLGILIQSSYLERTDGEQTEVLAITQGILEQRIDEARLKQGFQDLASLPLSPCVEPEFLYEQEVQELELGLKKLSVSVYYADRSNPGVPDSSRVRQGHALTLSVTLVEPVR